MQNDIVSDPTTHATPVTEATTPAEAAVMPPSAPEQIVTPGASIIASAVLTPTPAAVMPPDVPAPREAAAKPTTERPLSEDTVRIEYSFRICGGTEVIVDVNSNLDLPMALGVESLAQTDIHFPELLDRIVVQPLITRFRVFLQRRFDAASRATIEKETAEKETPPPVNMEFKRPKPVNGAAFAMPEIDAKPPLPRRPGSNSNFKP